MAKPLKQWKSYTQQLQLLESRGMIVTDNAKALNYLERVGYYRLSGYWYPFRQIDVQASKAQNKPIRKNEFVQQSNFENIVDLYIFDKNQNKTIEKNYNKMSTFDTLKIGDSVIKNANSWHIQVYRNSGNGYQFVDSFGIGRFN